MHTLLEHYLLGEKHADLTDIGQQATMMAEKVIDEGIKGHLDEVWGSEVTVWYPDLFAGATDVVGVYNGKESIVDFKQSLRPKKAEWIEDYFHQLAAYALAHDEIHGTEINFGVVLVAVQDGSTQEFTTTGEEFKQYKNAWKERVEKYYAVGGLPAPKTGSNGNKD